MDTERQITIGLPDGRRLGAALFGAGDVPFFFFHGLGGSRLSPGWMFPAPLLEQAGVRLIAMDRPGFGSSSARANLLGRRARGLLSDRWRACWLAPVTSASPFARVGMGPGSAASGHALTWRRGAR